MNHQGKWQSYASLSVIAAVAIAGGALAIIEARAAPPAETASEPAAETEVTVSFDTDPVKTGYVAGEGGTCAESLQRHVYATVSPKSARDDVTFTFTQTGADEEIELSEAEEFDDDQWEFDVGGLSATPANEEDGDTTIQAIYKGRVVGSAKAIVLAPATQEHAVEPATLENTATLVSILPAIWALGSKDGADVVITIHDQFDTILDSVYDGQSVEEEFTPGVPPFNSGRNPIGLPVGDVLTNGIKKDSCYSKKSDAYYTTDMAVALAWAAKTGSINGANNAFSLIGFSYNATATQRVWVAGHSVTPDYTRNQVQQSANFDPVPFSVTDTPAGN